jgi:protein TonB
MKQLLFILIFGSFSGFAQCDTTNFVEFPDVEAQYPGGTAKLVQYLQGNIEYPDEIEDIIDASKVYLEFIVCQNGTISNIQCIRPKNNALSERYIELVSKMPSWIPAEVKGQPVTSKCRIPITICFH